MTPLVGEAPGGAASVPDKLTTGARLAGRYVRP
jgi:hypothetical protein